ncbi:MAG: hypothetical protein ACK54A_11330 [Sphingobacteriales bacterium]
MAKYIFYAILLYMAYRLVFDVILPIRRTTKAMKDQFRQAQEQMQQAQDQAQQPSRPVNPQQGRPNGDYIDFEEVK